jgi:hypothetical protein
MFLALGSVEGRGVVGGAWIRDLTSAPGSDGDEAALSFRKPARDRYRVGSCRNPSGVVDRAWLQQANKPDKIFFCTLRVLFAAATFLAFALFGWAQTQNSEWVYPSATANLLYRLDERGQRILDFSHCGYRAGSEPLPDVSSLIVSSRWVRVHPADGDDASAIQAAINKVSAFAPDAGGWRGVVYLEAGEYQLETTLAIAASGVVLKGAGSSPASGTRLRATAPRQYTLIQVSGTGARSAISGTFHNLVQTLVPSGALTFQVDSTTGLAVGHTVIVRRPSPANWIVDIGMDLLGPASGGDATDVPWAADSRNLLFDRVITRIEGRWITVDAPLPQTFESKYGGGQIWRYTWPGRIERVGIETLYGFSDYAGATDEAHAWTFIELQALQNGWVRDITAQYFGYSAVVTGTGAKWITVADSRCLDPVSIITGSRRYSFDNADGELCLFVNNYARQGRHDFVLGSLVPGPNAFVQCTAENTHADTGPHHRWAVGALFDGVSQTDGEINIQNRGNLGSGHGWAGANSVVWNSQAAVFRVRNPPTARNWLVGSAGTILASAYPVGADPEGTYDKSGPAGLAVYPRSLYHGQLQQRLKWPRSEHREYWLGDIDQHTGTGGAGEPVNCDAAWLSQVEALDDAPASSGFDDLGAGRHTAFTFDFALDPGDTVVAASLTVGLRATGLGPGADALRLDSAANALTYAALDWTPLSTAAPLSRTTAVDVGLLADGRLNVALGTDSAADYAVLHLQVSKAGPVVRTVTLNPEADAYVRAGTANEGLNFGTTTTLLTKDVTVSSVTRLAYLRWDLSAVAGSVVQAKVRLAGISANQAGSENGVAEVSDDSWGETAITYLNRPAIGRLFGQWLPVAGQPVEFDVTPQASAALRDNRKLSLGISSTGDYGASGNVAYASRENATLSNRPQLILTLADVVETAAVWRQARFGNAGNTGTAADSADPDGDGMVNATEYVLGTTPTATDALAPLVLTRSDETVGVTFTAKKAEGVGYAGLTRSYALETCTDLGAQNPWTPVAGFTAIVGANQLVSTSLPLAAAICFFRLRITLQ